MGGEPTFVAVDDPEGEEWRTAAVGPTKYRFATALMERLARRHAPGGLLHHGQGKWYPGEVLPRWALSCYWRTDGDALWSRPDLLADTAAPGRDTIDDARGFLQEVARRVGVSPSHVALAYEDAWYHLWQERGLPVDVDPLDGTLTDDRDRRRLARLLDADLATPVGCLLPLARQWWQARAGWRSSDWDDPVGSGAARAR